MREYYKQMWYNIYKTQPPCFLLNFALGETSEVDSKPEEDEPGSLSADANVDNVKAKYRTYTEDFTIFRKILKSIVRTDQLKDAKQEDLQVYMYQDLNIKVQSQQADTVKTPDQNENIHSWHYHESIRVKNPEYLNNHQQNEDCTVGDMSHFYSEGFLPFDTCK